MNKTVLVTGASGGIGAAIATALAEAGYALVLHFHRNRERLEALVLNLPSTTARIVQFDMTDRDQCREVLTNDIELYGAYYGAICNAGITRDNAFPALSGEDWDAVIHTNLDSFYNVLNPLVMPMVRRRAPGRIVTLASVSGLIGNRGQTNYSAAKAGLIAASKSLALELAKRQITVNCVAPGLIDTAMLPPEVAEQARDMVPLKRLGKPEEVAALVRFLLSDEAGYITRQVLSVNGGLC